LFQQERYYVQEKRKR